MAKSSLDLTRVRNLGIIAHIDAGKTTTTEHILYYAGAIHRLGAVDSGNTTTDYDEEEQERGITIYSACIPLQWKGCVINLIDTPGHVDFTAEVERSLRVLDGCVVVFDAQKGVEAQSETVWRQADRYAVPRLAFINKMDVVGANFDNAVAEIGERLDGRPIPIVIPVGAGGANDSSHPFEAVIDLIDQKLIRYDPKDFGKTFQLEPIPEEMLDEVATRRAALFDILTEDDKADLITTTVLEGGEPDPTKVRSLLREATLARRLQPVLCGSGREHIGVQLLLDSAIAYLPCPLDRPAVSGTSPKKRDREETRKTDPKDPFCGLIFKIVADSHGELAFVRVYSGVLKTGTRSLNATRDTKELITKIYHTEADPSKRDELTEALAGDIVAVVGLKEAVTGDTLCDPSQPILLERIRFAESVVSQSVEPESGADKQKLADVLEIMRREDPTFNVKTDPETGQTLMSGMGTLHLEIKRHRMQRDFQLKIRVGKPRVSYRETLREACEIEGECQRVTGNGQIFGRVKVKFEPIPLDQYSNAPVAEPDPEPTKKSKSGRNAPAKPAGQELVRVRSILKHDTLPEPMELAAIEGLRSALQSGELGYPVMGVSATLIKADFDPATSTDMAFGVAASDAVAKALRQNIMLLEPVMKLEVSTPEEYLGPITGDLNSRHAEIRDIILRGKLRVVEALVPMARLFDYADKIRSLSKGRASSTMEPCAYAPAPDEVLQKMLNPEF
jgi:elongation factor G